MRVSQAELNALLQALVSAETPVRDQAASRLEYLQDARTVRPLLKLLEEGTATERATAVSVLGGLGGVGDAPVAAKALGAAAGDGDWEVRRNAVRALGAL